MPTPLTLELDVQCLNCGYNLRTLQLDSRCPECGEPVLKSPGRRPFAQVNRRTLQHVALGLLLAMPSSLLTGIVVFLAFDSYRWPALVSLFPGGDKGWLLLVAFSNSRFVTPWLSAIAIVSLVLHLLAVWLLTTAAAQLPGVYSRRLPYRAIALLSCSIIALNWSNAASLNSLFAILAAAILDFVQMLFFLNWAISIAQAAPFYDLETSLARARDLFLSVMLVITMGFCGACAYASTLWPVQLIMACICIIPATMVTSAVIRLAWRINQIQPLLAE